MSLVLNSGFTIGPGVVLDAGYTPPPTIITDGLVLHYDFSDPACYIDGVTINDLSTANNEGSIVNDAGAISYVSSTTSYFNWSTSAGRQGSFLLFQMKGWCIFKQSSPNKTKHIFY